MGLGAMNLVFLMLSFKSALSCSSFTLFKRLFSFSRIISSAYLRLLVFLLAFLIPVCDSFSLTFRMTYSAQELNKQGDSIHLGHCCWAAQSCLTPGDPMDCSTVGFPVFHHLLGHWTFLSPPDTFTTERCSCFSPATSFSLKLLVISLCSFLVIYCTLSGLGSSSSGVISFCLFTLSKGLSRQKYWTRLPFPSPKRLEYSALCF